MIFWPFFTLPYWLLRWGAWGPGGAGLRLLAFARRRAPQPADPPDRARDVAPQGREQVGTGVADGVPGRRAGPVDVTRRRRERASEPAAHRLDRGGTDDRPRARDPRRDAGRRDHLVVHRRGERPLHRRLRDHCAEQLLADPDRRRGGGGEGAGSHRRRQRPHRRSARLRGLGVRDGRRSGHGPGDQHGLEEGLAGRVRTAR